MGILDGKVALIFGVANHRSIGWGIAKALHEAGATIAFSIFNDDLRRRVEPLAEEVNAEFIEACNVTNDEELDATFEKFKEKYGKLDILVHSVAFAPKDDLGGRFIDISREGFQVAMDSSVYSLIAMAKRAEPMMPAGSSIINLTFYAAEKYIPDYNVMAIAKAALETTTQYLAVDMGEKGIRVNSISAGAVKTLAAAGIPGFRDLLKQFQHVIPLKIEITVESIGKSAVFLASDLAELVTGEVLHVDGGFHTLGMTATKEQLAIVNAATRETEKESGDS